MNASHANPDAATTTTLSTTLGELVEALAGESAGGFAAEIQGDAETVIRRIGPLDTQEPDTLSFLSNPKYRSQLADTQAVCVIISPAVQADAAQLRSAIVTPTPIVSSPPSPAGGQRACGLVRQQASTPARWSRPKP